MADLDLQARRVRMRTKIEDAMGRLVALDRDNPAHAAGAGNVVAGGDAAPIPPLPLLKGVVHPPPSTSRASSRAARGNNS
jgi:hypothetical protein